ncbi:MAG: F0F1 ATP synthase subunit B [Pseudomonadota bacterium]|nr:F0F1 ATP synthase subunit B [Pseudomonadota bacterium]
MADPYAVTDSHAATTEATHAAPSLNVFGLHIEAAGFVSLAMLAVIAILLWKKVPAAIGRALDGKIAAIREQLAEAEALRKEAEALKAEYQAKAAAADAESAATIERAKVESEAILAKARVDAETLIERRGRMAEDKIAAEERAAVDQLRATAAEAARKAAVDLIAVRLDDQGDAALVSQAIDGIGGR